MKIAPFIFSIIGLGLIGLQYFYMPVSKYIEWREALGPMGMVYLFPMMMGMMLLLMVSLYGVEVAKKGRKKK